MVSWHFREHSTTSAFTNSTGQFLGLEREIYSQSQPDPRSLLSSEVREAPGLVFADEETEVAPQQQLAPSSISRTLQCVPQMLRKASRRPFQKVLQPPVEYDEIWANRSVRKREHRLLWRLDYFLRGKNDHTDFSHTQNCEKIRTSSQLSCRCPATWLMILP